MSEHTFENPDNVEENQQEVTPEEPQNAEPTPVDASPADQSEPSKSDTILGKNYTVDPDRGYRQQG